MTASDTGHVPPPPPAYTSTPRVAVSGFPVAALVVGTIAFLVGWLPFAGIVIGIVGIVLGSLAARSAVRRGLAITGLVLSAIATVINVLVVIVVLVWLPAIERDRVDPFTSTPDADPATPLVDTSCYRFDLPARYEGNDYDVESWNESAPDCIAQVEIWSADGESTGAGVTVTPYTASTANLVSDGGTPEGVADFVEQNGMTGSGTLVIDRKAVVLAGAPATLTRYDRASTAGTSVMVVATARDELLTAVLDTWKWT
jgi:hypothetical protein